MFGSLRAILTVFVAVSHLADEPFYNFFGRGAVFGFYVIPGYLVTRVLNETYKTNLFAFFLNRTLRIYPPYLFILLVSWPVVAIFSSEAKLLTSLWRMGAETSEYLANIFIFPLAAFSVDSIRGSTRIVLPAWSVAVELQCYIILALFTSRSRLHGLLTLTLAIGIHVALSVMKAVGYSKITFGRIYYQFYAAILPFSIGEVLYFYQSLIASKPRQYRIHMSITIAAWLANLILSQYIS